MTRETPKERKKRLNRERMARYRANLRDGASHVSGPIRDEMIDDLIDAQRLLEDESGNPKEIFNAIVGIAVEFLASIKKKPSA